MPEISVIVPVYNVEKYLAKCLDSICKQTFKDIEIICVNDGSTDNSLKILEEYASKDNRIKVISQENRGLSGARNTGLKHAQSKYINFVDSDDWIEPETLELAYKAMTENDVDIVHYYASVINENMDCDKYVKNIMKYFKITYTGFYKIDEKLIYDTTVTVWNKLFKKDLIDKYQIIFAEKRLYEDDEFSTMYQSIAKNTFYVDKQLYNYILRANSLTGKNNTKGEKQPVKSEAARIKIVSNLYDFFINNNLYDKYPKLIEKLFKRYLYLEYIYSNDVQKQQVLEYASQLAVKMNECTYNSKNKFINNLVKKKYYKIDFLDITNFWTNLFSIIYANGRLIIRLLGLKLKIRIGS